MKIELTHEQNMSLIKLGVDPKKASGNDFWNPNVNGRVFHQPVFTLADLLVILPKALRRDDLAYWYNFKILWREKDEQWYVTYDSIGESMAFESATELIDALYKLTCWYYGEYLKSEEK